MVFEEKKNKQQINYLCVIITLSPKQEKKKKNLTGKLNEKKKKMEEYKCS